jgi:preprotein translocase subunit SecG
MSMPPPGLNEPRLPAEENFLLKMAPPAASLPLGTAAVAAPRTTTKTGHPENSAGLAHLTHSTNETVITQLYLVRTEMQDLKAVLDNIQAGSATLGYYAAYIRKTMADIQVIMTNLPDSEQIRSLQNTWEQLQANPLLTTPEAALEAQDQLHYLNLVGQKVSRIEFLVGYITIPERLNSWLSSARPGYYIPFHQVFEDEIPSPADRTKILNFLTWSPNSIKGGLVDPVSGLIYRYSENPRERMKSIWLLILVLLLAPVLLAIACYLPIPNWPLQQSQFPILLGGWVTILIGVIVHIAVGTLKQNQRQGGLPPVFALGDLSLLIDARSGNILQKILLTLIGLFGLTFALGINNVTPLNAFLVGYSLDSIIELFGNNLEKQVEAQTAIFKRKVGG